MRIDRRRVLWALIGPLALAALFAPSPARADEKTPEDALIERLQGGDPADRERACAELAVLPKRTDKAFSTLSWVMTRDLSDRVRLAAAKAVISFEGDESLRKANLFLQSEPGTRTRSEFMLALSTELAHAGNSDVTRAIAGFLADDPSPEVRIAAAQALALRGDSVGLPPALRALEHDPDKSVREAAGETVRILSAPPKVAAKPKKAKPAEPKPDAVKGQDPCPPPYAWCECTGIIRRAPKCLTRSECHAMYNHVLGIGLSCTWSGIDLGQDLTREKLPSPPP